MAFSIRILNLPFQADKRVLIMKPLVRLSPVLLLSALLPLGSCAGSLLPGQAGSRVYVRLVDAKTVIFDDVKMSWDACLDDLEARVRKAGDDPHARPWVCILAKIGTADGLASRFLDALQGIGVTSISLGS